MPLFLPGPGPWVNPSTEIQYQPDAASTASQVDAASLDRAGDRALGALAVSPTTAPGALDHARALGAPTTTVVTVDATVVQAPKPRASLPKRPQRSRIISFQTATIAPSGQTHTRAIGSPLVNPTATPAGLDRTSARALGSLAVTTVAPDPVVVHAGQTRGVTARIRPAKAQRQGLLTSRIVKVPATAPVTTITTYGLDRTGLYPGGYPGEEFPGEAVRVLGSPTVTTTVGIPTVVRVVQPKRAGRTVQASQVVSGLTPFVAVSPQPASLDHSRALGTPTVSPQVRPSGQTHTRALGSPLVNVTAVPGGLSHTRAIGDLTVTAVFGVPTVHRVVQPKLAGRTVQASRIVSGLAPTVPLGVAPSGLEHTRALGSPVVAVLEYPPPTVHRVVQPRRAGRTVQGAQVIAGFAPPTGVAPASLVRTRELGLPWTIPSDAGTAPHVVFAGAVRGVIRALRPRKRLPEYTSAAEALAYGPEEAGPPTPAGIVHTRALGTITVQRQSVRQLGNPTVTVAWVERPSGLSHTRALGTITVIGRKVEPSSLTRTRIQGTPTLSGRVILTGIAHVRATSSPSVNPRTLSPASLSHTRNQGTHTVTLVKISRPVSLEHSTRALGSPTARGKMEIGPPSLTRTRAQGTPILSGRVMPVGLLNLRVLGDPAVNVRTLVPVALDRA
jgi:hypothetical protein